MLPLRAKTDETISPKSPFLDILAKYRNAAKTEREKGTYFEELIVTYLRNEPTYKDLYKTVQTYSDWAAEQGTEGKDTGIDLVALTNGTNEYHAIQCKFYAENHRIQKSDIDSFFTASGKAPFKHRVIITTTNNWGEHAENALNDQTPPVTKIDLHALENSQIDWAQYQPHHAPVLKEKKALRPHQQRALQAVKEAFQTVDRGKLLMACGTGKTFTSLKIAEAVAGKNKRVLFLVPSLSLLSQTLTEWTQESDIPLRSFAVCSDSDVGKKRNHDDDVVQTFTHELQYPATTNAKSLAKAMGQRHDNAHMTVVFSTYHSLAVIHEAQQQHGLPAFDLIVGDEAHRTTGATFDGDEEGIFVRVHDADYIKAHKRLYMTATPRIYAPLAKATAERDSIALCSMDDPAIYGETLFTITFSEAVTLGLLVDYKVIVLTIDEAHISSRLQKLLADEDNQLKVDDAAKIVGCWKALSKQEQEKTLLDDDAPMQRAVAFCQVIEPRKKAKVHKVSSKNIAAMFQRVVEAYQEQEDDHNTLICEAEHVDGSMNATEKENKLKWLKADLPDDKCRILSNVRCLSEGVDVPALDAVLFLTPRDSQVDVVQSVGRIMRNAPNKKRGYVILPVVIPTGMEPHDALNDNKTYKVVWEVLNALRSHDDRFDAHINKLELIGKDNQKMEVIAITDKVGKKNSKNSPDGETGKGEYKIGEKAATKAAEQLVFDLKFKLGEIERALYAKIVQKCGNRHHWEDWATDIAKIAQTHITRIRAILDTPENTKEIDAFTAFAGELRDDLNGSITDDEVIEMLAQHLITKPVFDALFEGYSFAGSNPVSQAMQHTLDVLQQHHLDKETDTLEQFYQSVKMRAAGIENAAAKQKIVVELYDKFFRKAFPKMTERLGIVYTPVEIVDFIIHSVNDVLKEEFGQTLGSKGVHIIDPFTGTGTFITRMLQSGLISPEQLPHKYAHEIHANEIVLLAYYIAAINIEAVYHGLMGGDYKPFQGICLTDTFQLYEKDDLISKLLVDNSARRTRQKNLPIRVIMGNPPYSAGQQSANDNAANIAYPHLDASIAKTYAAHTQATNKNALYDSYIRAIRWGSDRLGDSGVLAYVSGGAWAERPFANGMRKCLQEDFTNLYVFHLRGDVRKNMLSKGKAREGGNVFGSGSMTGIAISVFVKNPNAKTHGNIFYHDIGDDLSEQQKIEIIQTFKSINGIKAAGGWQPITPDKHHDWLTQRDDSFEAFISLGDKKDKKTAVLFENYSRGLETNRDAWCYNSSYEEVSTRIQQTINFYNKEVARFKDALLNTKITKIEDFLVFDPKQISWNRSLKHSVSMKKNILFNETVIQKAVYRPFKKEWVYFDNSLNAYVNQLPRIFPYAEAENRVICVSGVGARSGFSAMMVDAIPNLHTLDTGQCFPLYLYEPATEEAQNPALITMGTTQNGYTRRDAISKEGLQHFQAAYPSETLTKEDVFYYVYGLLHSPAYRDKYGDNLSKELPRMPRVKTAADFWAFSTAGRALAELHIGYETAEPYPATLIGNPKTDDDYRVTKMKFASKGDKSTIIYNAHITLKDIPLAAFDYVVNGKPAVEWVMERQCVKTDKDSGIVNDANLYATETMGNAKYPLEVLLRVITVSLKTSDIVAGLPMCAYLEDA
jgi:predicted helicase